MGFLSELQATLDEEFNLSMTEKGAYGYRTTGSKLVDLNFAVSSLRNRKEDDAVAMFAETFDEDPVLAVKWLFFAADVRGGLGERRLFRICMKYLAEKHPDVARKVFAFTPEYTRFDNLLPLLDTPISEDVLAFIKKQLEKDVENMQTANPVSLLAKWMPSINASKEETRRYARMIIAYLKVTQKTYRKTLTKLRAYLKVIEVDMSAGRWGEIDYEKVPSRANLIYSGAFLKNDAERREKYLDALQKGEATIHADVLFPHDIVYRYCSLGCRSEVDPAMEALWKALPDFVQGDTTTICVSDGSGSMTTRATEDSFVSCLDVANALSIYFAERCRGEFKDKYITFSATPQLVDMSKCKTLREKVSLARRYNEIANTNIEAVFDLILTTAVKFNMPPEDVPKNILILSDMEFDYAVEDNALNKNVYERLFTTIGKKFAEKGYRLPRIVFWNICSRTGTIPLTENEMGVALVSGFSPVVARMVLSGELDPYKVLLEQLNDKRYEPIENALK